MGDELIAQNTMLLENLILDRLIIKGTPPCVHKRQPLVSIMSQMNPIHIAVSYSFKMHFNITLPYLPVFQMFYPPVDYKTIIFMELYRSHAC
jgi:hypothetical protein